MFADDFVIDLVEVSKIESSHSTDDGRSSVNGIRTEIKAGTSDATAAIQEDQNCEGNAILDDDDSFLEMVYILLC